MWFLIRIAVAGIFFYTFYQGFFQSGPLDGVEVAILMFVFWLGAIVMSIVWAPAIGSSIADPLTSGLTGSAAPPSEDRLAAMIRRLQMKSARRTALLFCMIEGLRYPDLPHPPLMALQSTRPGSLLEKWMAREVYQYSNVANCMRARKILMERHGEIPPVHPVAEVARAIQVANREVPPPASVVEMGPQPPLNKPPRNPRIRLFNEL